MIERLIPFLLVALQAVAAFCFSQYQLHFDDQPAVVRWSNYAVCGCTVATAALAWFNGRRAREEKLRGDAYAMLLAAVAKIAEASHVPASAFGLTAYVVRRPLLRPCAPIQMRIARVRLGSGFPPSSIEWTKDKGIVGECWRKKDMVIQTVIADHFKSVLKCTRDQWEIASSTLKMGLTYEEWEATQQRYAYVCAVPIQSERKPGKYKYVGCVSLDTRSENHINALRKERVVGLMVDTAGTIDFVFRGKG